MAPPELPGQRMNAAASAELEQFVLQPVFRHAGFAHQLAHLVQQALRTAEADLHAGCARALDPLRELLAEPRRRRGTAEIRENLGHRSRKRSY